ncbi:MAG: GAF domain-containing protein [Caldilineaceae bacterium]
MLHEKVFQDQVDRFFDWVDTDTGLRALIAVIRTGVLLALIYYFFPLLNHPDFKNQRIAILVSLICFTLYTIVFGLEVLHPPEVMQTLPLKIAQPVTEIGFYILFYLLSRNSWSDIFFLCFLPLFLSFRYLTMRSALIILAVTALSFSAALFVIKTATGLDTFIFIRTLLARNFFLLLFPTLFYSVRHRFSVMEAVRREHSEWTNAFDALGAGVIAIGPEQQILFVNRFLRERHGQYTERQTCAAYLRCQGAKCDWCSNRNRSATTSALVERVFKNKDEQSYHATITPFPLFDQGRAMGAMAIITDISKHTQHEQQLAQTLAQTQGRERDLTQERAKWLQTYNDLGKRLTGYADLEGLLQFVVDQVKVKMNVEVASLFLFDRHNEFLVRKSTAGIEAEWEPDEKYRMGDGLVGNTVAPVGEQKYGRPLHFVEADKDPHINLVYLHKYQEKLQSHLLKHLVTVPLNGKDRSFGVLRVINKLEKNGALSQTGFIQKDVDFLVTIASMIAIAVENTALLQETKQYLSDIKAVHDSSQTVASSLNREEMLNKVVNIAGRVSSSDHTSIVLVDDEGRLIMSVEDHPIQPPPHERARPTGMTTQILKTHQAVFVADVTDNPSVHNPAILDCGFRSYAGIPIVARQKLLGVLFVHSKQTNAFAHQADILEIFCNHVATALENIRLYQQMSDVARLEARRLLSEDLHDTMNFLHATLVMGIAYQQELFENQAYTEAAANLSKSRKAATHTYRTLQRLMTDVRDPILQDQGLIPALQHYVEMLPSLVVTFEVHGHAALPKDVEYAIYRIAQEAISNAFKHSGHTEQVQVTVELCKTPTNFRLDVADNGNGFDVALTQKNKDAFGLQAMERWARSIHAQYDIASQPGAGTQVCVLGAFGNPEGIHDGHENSSFGRRRSSA